MSAAAVCLAITAVEKRQPDRHTSTSRVKPFNDRAPPRVPQWSIPVRMRERIHNGISKPVLIEEVA
jgi:hypothetical protein